MDKENNALNNGSYDKLRSSRGFTIVELLIVVVIIAILATITVVAYNGVQQRAQAARLSTEIANITTKLELFNGEFSYYPAAINDCPTPAANKICLAPPADESYTYKANVVGVDPSMPNSSKVLNVSYEIQINGAKSVIYSSNAERTTSTGGEFTHYVDLAPMIDTYGLRKYQLSFDIKSANTATQSMAYVYLQNGAGSRYLGIEQNVNVSTSYQHYDISFTPVLNNASVIPSILAFYGTWGSGNILTVKDVKVTLAP